MSTALSSPVTGAAQSSLSSPTYTIAVDVAPSANGRQYAVTACGGTQTGVNTHTPSNPFTITIVRPSSFKTLGQVSSANGIPTSFPRNTWRIIMRKGVAVTSAIANIAPQVATITCDIAVPAGSELNSKTELQAMLSMFIGSLNQFSSSFSDSVVTGVA